MESTSARAVCGSIPSPGKVRRRRPNTPTHLCVTPLRPFPTAPSTVPRRAIGFAKPQAAVKDLAESPVRRLYCYPGPVRLGIHTFTSGGLEGAARTAADLGANTFQIFSASPRMWRVGTPDPHQVRLLRAARDRHDLHPLVIHVNYLINLA